LFSLRRVFIMAAEMLCADLVIASFLRSGSDSAVCAFLISSPRLTRLFCFLAEIFSARTCVAGGVLHSDLHFRVTKPARLNSHCSIIQMRGRAGQFLAQVAAVDSRHTELSQHRHRSVIRLAILLFHHICLSGTAMCGVTAAHIFDDRVCCLS